MYIQAAKLSCLFLWILCTTSEVWCSRTPKPEELTSEYWYNVGSETLKNILAIREINKPAKNVIFFLGDGMSIATVTAARIYDGQLKGQNGEDNKLFFETFPNVALSKTYNVDKQVPDSAATATAFFGGVKANYHTVGVNAQVKVQDCQASLNKSNHVHSVLKWAQDAGKDTGFVTTMRVTHATPAGLYAHTAERDWECVSETPDGCKDIAAQLVEDSPGNALKVILGGGIKHLVPIEKRGTRDDGRNLIYDWAKSKVNYTAKFIQDKKGLLSTDPVKTDYLLGLFNFDHMTDEVDRLNKTHPVNVQEPSIVNMTMKAIEMLRKNEKGYFLMVEGGKIDWSHHTGQAKRALAETVAFSEAVKTAVEMTSEEDTLIVVTADHSHVMTINGYPERGNDILGTVASLDNDQYPHLPYTTLMYTNGPGYREPPPLGKGINIIDYITEADDYHQLAAFPKTLESHGGDDVAIYARGPMAHLFRGVVEQNYIAHAVGYAACYKEPMHNDCNNDENHVTTKDVDIQTENVENVDVQTENVKNGDVQTENLKNVDVNKKDEKTAEATVAKAKNAVCKNIPNTLIMLSAYFLLLN